MLLGAAAVVFLVCIACLLSFAAWRGRSGKGKMPPGPSPLPILGNVLQVKPKNLAKTLQKLSEEYGPVFTVHLGFDPVVVLYGHDVVKEALVDRGDEFAARGQMPIGDRTNNGLGIVFSNNEEWLQVRRFALSTLRNFGMGKRSVEERIQEEAEYLLEEINKTKGTPFDPTFMLSCAVSNVICSIVFGKRYDYKDKKFLALMNNMNNIFEMMNSLWGQLYQMFPKILDHLPGPHNNIFAEFDSLKDFVSEEVKTHQASLDPSSPQDFIDCFLSKMEEEKEHPNSSFHLKNVITSTFDLFLAGTETTSTTIRYGLLLLLRYPKIQEKVQEEIDRVVGQSRRPCVADRAQMPYTDAVVHEIQRFISLIPLGLPHTVAKDTCFREYIIPKGTTIFPILSSVLHDSKEFPNPDEFNPGHFLNENGTFRKSEFFMPFSAGKRICPGEGLARMEIFLLVATILQNFTLKPVIDPQDLNITPTLSGTGNVPPAYQLCAVPR
ncbi:cytochrome P450 2C19-like isoform X1 [Falco biarmicus]|uniref:cytochrome P450 2C19-like isoform X1 n=1 Tax=Falco peregrinus TaxID=8954 RepID=UPI00038709DB|nr:cytochrome P450 2C19-like isoform X1 [Falco peregrinus]XP_005433370.1 cytochrome P450 2C19-like isoform X1 [Falco cherrug]XP_037255912.1 cytochrome P450 2C19-like isoform X1 [Falco rusticolus]XP_056208672.1 cytochrome P450 2C19-like isoform X1 [Falco biarmicus]